MSSFHLLIFPIGQLVVWIFPTIHRIVNLVDNRKGEPILSVLHYSSLSLTGVVNMFIYGCNPLVRSHLRVFYEKYIKK